MEKEETLVKKNCNHKLQEFISLYQKNQALAFTKYASPSEMDEMLYSAQTCEECAESLNNVGHEVILWLVEGVEEAMQDAAAAENPLPESLLKALEEQKKLFDNIAKSWGENGQLLSILEDNEELEASTAENLQILVARIFASIATNFSQLLLKIPGNWHSAELKVLKTGNTYEEVYAGDEKVAESEDFARSIALQTGLGIEGSKAAFHSAIEELHCTKIYPDLAISKRGEDLLVKIEPHNLDPTTCLS